MKEAIDILRKAINSEDEFRQRYSHPTMLKHSENHYNEYKLLNQPEHKAQGWELGTTPYGNGLPIHGVPEDHKVKAVELRTGTITTGEEHRHVIYKPRHRDSHGRTLDFPWKRTTVVEHSSPLSIYHRDPGHIVGEGEYKSLHEAVADTRMHGGSWTPTPITKIHYHDESK